MDLIGRIRPEMKKNPFQAIEDRATKFNTPLYKWRWPITSDFECCESQASTISPVEAGQENHFFRTKNFSKPQELHAICFLECCGLFHEAKLAHNNKQSTRAKIFSSKRETASHKQLGTTHTSRSLSNRLHLFLFAPKNAKTKLKNQKTGANRKSCQ
jgi:hypothetical protein